MRKVWLSLLLPLLMLLSQQGAVWHEIGHRLETGRDAGPLRGTALPTPAERHDRQPADKVCAACLAFAHLAAAARPHLPALPPPDLRCAQRAAVAPRSAAAAAPAPRSRGPPVFL